MNPSYAIMPSCWYEVWDAIISRGIAKSQRNRAIEEGMENTRRLKGFSPRGYETFQLLPTINVREKEDALLELGSPA